MQSSFIAPTPLSSKFHTATNCRPAVCRTNRTSPKMSSSRAPNQQSDLTYASSGVDIDTEAASVQALINSLKKGPVPRTAGTRGSIVPHAGGFSGLLDFGDKLLAMCTDGVGSKLLLAAELNYYESIALDCVAMNVNDLLCVGAEPLAFVDYIAAPAPNPETWAALGRSLAEACRRARISLCGGESASLPDMVSTIDLSGTALGWLPRGMQLDGSSVAVGDAIIGLPSSGIHSNGYSLVRKVLDRCGRSLEDIAPFDVNSADAVRADGSVWRHSSSDSAVTLGEVLLNPTKIYVDPVVDMLLACQKDQGPCPYSAIHGIAHITGGGLSNLLRLRSGAGFEITNPLSTLAEFKWLQEQGDLSNYEMYRTFNMGMGLTLIIDAKYAKNVMKWLEDHLPGCKNIGTVNDSGKVTHTLFPDVVFDRY